jgi:hypothetical protein
MTDKFHIHIKTIENGYILKDLTGQKEGVDPKTYVATTMKDLKDRILSLVDTHLPSQKPTETDGIPDNAFNSPGGK